MLSLMIMVTSLLFISFYVFYFIICYISIKKSKKNKVRKYLQSKDENLPIVSLIIPVYNESKVIPYKFENLKKINYPKEKLDVIFVDGGSIDGSADYIQQLSNKIDLNINLIRQNSRNGFNNAVIEGFNKSVGEIIFIPGAETEYDRNVLKLCVRYFQNQQVGVVTGRQKYKNVTENFVTKIEMSYRTIYDFVRHAESNIDCPFLLRGEISCARSIIYQNLINIQDFESKGNIDSCCTFQAKKDGFKTIYEPDAVFYEYSTNSFQDSWKQQSRRAVTLIQNLLIFKNMILNNKYGLFGILIMPSNFLMLMVLPFLFLFSISGIIVFTIMHHLYYLLFLLMSVSFILMTQLKFIQAFIKAQLVLVHANMKLIFGVETQKFEKLESYRPNIKDVD